MAVPHSSSQSAKPFQPPKNVLPTTTASSTLPSPPRTPTSVQVHLQAWGAAADVTDSDVQIPVIALGASAAAVTSPSGAPESRSESPGLASVEHDEERTSCAVKADSKSDSHSSRQSKTQGLSAKSTTTAIQQGAPDSSIKAIDAKQEVQASGSGPTTAAAKADAHTRTTAASEGASKGRTSPPSSPQVATDTSKSGGQSSKSTPGRHPVSLIPAQRAKTPASPALPTMPERSAKEAQAGDANSSVKRSSEQVETTEVPANPKQASPSQSPATPPVPANSDNASDSQKSTSTMTKAERRALRRAERLKQAEAYAAKQKARKAQAIAEHQAQAASTSKQQAKDAPAKPQDKSSNDSTPTKDATKTSQSSQSTAQSRSAQPREEATAKKPDTASEGAIARAAKDFAERVAQAKGHAASRVAEAGGRAQRSTSADARTSAQKATADVRATRATGVMARRDDDVAPRGAETPERPGSADSRAHSKYYVVKSGFVPGIYYSWSDCQAQVLGHDDPLFRAFGSLGEADAYMRAPNPKSSSTAGPQTAYYAVQQGRVPGVYSRWSEARDQVLDYPEPIYRKFSNLGEAEDFVRMNEDYSSDSRTGKENIAEPLPGSRQTSARAELAAIARALEVARRDFNVAIFSDSRYAVNCLTNWYASWQRNQWKTSDGRPVENKDVIQSILQKVEEREKLHASTRFEWVRGHNRDKWNDMADKLANDGVRKAFKQQERLQGHVTVPVASR
ncbi:hypothetical protein KEM52_003989 [Ascosphaera acerosa]|nr:hypothetical protein KEM52_003989 [Ascosphaera acerosa]